MEVQFRILRANTIARRNKL